MKVLLILPAYNEEGNILNTAAAIRAANFPGVDFVVIDDGSRDRTAALCRAHGIRCVSLVHNLGIGGAVQTGYLIAAREGYDAAVQFDGDGQHDILSLPALLEPLEAGTADLVVGSRFLTGASGFQSTGLRRLGIRWLSWLLHLLSGLKVYDMTSGYRAAGRKAIEYMAREYPVDYPEPESLLLVKKQGMRVTEVPANMFERAAGKSSITPLRSVYYMIKVSLALICAAFRREVKK